ncbi:MAG: MBOAT family protein [Lachnospiraceae bacterium]|nr:MBOAT family protein [Lachnospiraceae bacterium]
MLFNSTEFLLGFLPIFILLYYATQVKYRTITLFAGSIFFYAYGEPIYVFLLFLSIVLNYVVSKYIGKKRKRNNWRRRRLYICAVVLNVLVLATFKWLPVFGSSLPFADIGMPLGISFYTFQILSYLTDIYRGEIVAESSFLKIAAYISMFPQLTSGPIVRYEEISEVLKTPKMKAEDFDGGLKTFVCGLALKVLLADRLAILWHEIQTTGFISISTPLAWLGAFGFSLEIYFDFYGYSLMALGLGRILGFSLPENFRMPYMASSVREFYRRWHMSLKNWFQKYVYIPLGGSRKGMFRTVLNLLVVWLLTAIWHGGTLNFLIWGLSLWFFITLERLILSKYTWGKWKIPGHLYVWFVIPLTWMCFAITDLGELGIYFGRMFGLVEGISVYSGDFIKALNNYGVFFGIGLLLCTPLAEKVYKKCKDSLLGMLLLAVIFWLCIWRILAEGNNPFMYLRF